MSDTPTKPEDFVSYVELNGLPHLKFSDGAGWGTVPVKPTMKIETVAAWWRRVAPKLRRALGYEPPTHKEADRLMAEADEVPISDEEIDRIVDFVCPEKRDE